MSRKRCKVLSSAARCPGLTSGLTDLVHKLIRDLFDPYRPEMHYMRGPGPKWRQKHARSAEFASWIEKDSAWRLLRCEISARQRRLDSRIHRIRMRTTAA